MTEKQTQGWPDKVSLFPKLQKAGEFISHFILGPHLFSPVSDHKFDHPFDHELYDRTDALNNMNQVCDPEIEQ